MDLDLALAFATDHTRSVLVTQRRSGRPQLSNVVHHVCDGVVAVSITAGRAKYANLRREPWAALHVTREDFWAYAVLEGPVELSAPAADPQDAVVADLVDLYRSLRGEHPDWDAYRAAMVEEARVIVRLRPDHAYGMIPDEG